MKYFLATKIFYFSPKFLLTIILGNSIIQIIECSIKKCFLLHKPISANLPLSIENIMTTKTQYVSIEPHVDLSQFRMSNCVNCHQSNLWHKMHDVPSVSHIYRLCQSCFINNERTIKNKKKALLAA